mmetsp:Transcript_3075/g.10291  ORF Transcript_3075/g.10291 Transcript_3075/m.10291 type:complete len:243 (+) Transcript_3075:500-1228(+)
MPRNAAQKLLCSPLRWSCRSCSSQPRGERSRANMKSLLPTLTIRTSPPDDDPATDAFAISSCGSRLLGPRNGGSSWTHLPKCGSARSAACAASRRSTARLSSGLAAASERVPSACLFQAACAMNARIMLSLMPANARSPRRVLRASSVSCRCCSRGGGESQPSLENSTAALMATYWEPASSNKRFTCQATSGTAVGGRKSCSYPFRAGRRWLSLKNGGLVQCLLSKEESPRSQRMWRLCARK